MKSKVMIVVLLLLLTQAKANTSSNGAVSTSKYLRIEVTCKDYKGGKAPDTMLLSAYDVVIGGTQIGESKVIVATRTDHKMPFQFDVQVERQFGYFQLFVKPPTASGVEAIVPILLPQFWELGDSLKIKIDPRETSVNSYKTAIFSGAGSAKYTARYALQNLRLPFADSVDFSSFQDYITQTKYEKRKLDILEDFRATMSDLSYNILKADICYQHRNYGFHFIKEIFKKIAPDNQNEIESFRKMYHATFDKDFNFGISQQGLSNSEEYLQFLYTKISIETYIHTLGRDLDDLFNTITSSSTGSAREALLVYFFRTERNTEASSKNLNKASELIKEQRFKEALSDLKINIPGWIMADYTLTNDKGQKVKLSDFDDKVVLLDFWGAGCGACIVFYKNTLSKVQDQLHGNKDFVVLSVSEDVSPTTWKVGLKSGNFTDDRAVHLYTNGKGRFDPFIVDNRMNVLPSVIILDKGRKVKFFNTDELYEFNGLLSALKQVLNGNLR